MALSFSPAEEIIAATGHIERKLDRACRSKHRKPFRSWLAQRVAIAKADLRIMQMNCAETGKGNPRMLIWLGMQHLDQSPNVVELNKPGTPAQPTPQQRAEQRFITTNGQEIAKVEHKPGSSSAPAAVTIEVEAILMEELAADQARAAGATPAKTGKPREILIDANTGEPLDG